MEVVQLGPFVVPLYRVYVALSIAAFVLVAELVARKGRPRVAVWAWNAALLGLLGARLGYVGENAAAFLQEPLAVFYVWQGGFDVFWGLLAGAAYTLYFFHRTPGQLRLALWPLAAGFVVAAALFGLSFRGSEGERVLPDWTLPRLDGGQVRLAEFRGTPLVVNFWASWCPPCRREMPLLSEYAAKETGVVFLFVNLQERPDTARAFLQKEGLDLTWVLLDLDGRLAHRMRVAAIPTTFFVSKSGEIVDQYMGELSRARLEQGLGRLER